MNELNPGLIEDPRTEAQKLKDFQHVEIFGAPEPVVWVEKAEKDWAENITPRQDGSSSCVAFSTVKVRGLEHKREDGEYVELSPRDIYTRRKNFPSEGMWFTDAMDIVRKHGVTLEALMPSYMKNEAKMNDASDRTISSEQEALKHREPSYVQIPMDIDAIASIIAQKKGVLLGFTFSPKEWKKVTKYIGDTPFIRHAVAGVDFFLYKGEKAILVDDSSFQSDSFGGRRVVTESFLKKRILFAGYFVDLIPVPPPVKPHHTFIFKMEFGDRGPNVVALQDILKYEGLFLAPVSTGYYGAVTAKGVLAFQRRYKVDTEANLADLAGMAVGPKTRAKLNELYGT